MNDSEDLFKNIRNKSAAEIKQFIEANIPNVNALNPAGLSMLHFAAEYADNVEVVKVLLSMGAKVDIKGQGGFTPLHMAATYGNVEIAKILISNRANVSSKENNGFTPLHIAAVARKTANGRNIEIAKILVSKGADVNARSNTNAKGGLYTPLDLAEQIGDTPMIQYLASIKDELEKQYREEELKRREEAERKHREEQERQAKEKAKAEEEFLKLIAELTEKINLNPNDANTYNLRGFAYTQKGEMKLAFKDFNKAIELNPNNADAYFGRSNVYFNEGEDNKAIADLDKSIKLNPNNEGPYFCRGSIYSDKKGDQNKAIADFEAALRINPNNSFVRQLLKQAQERKSHKIKEKKKHRFMTIFIVLGVFLVSLTLYKNIEKPKKQERTITTIPGSFTDSRNGKIYKTIKIDTQTWLAENLDYNAKGSKCYNNVSANCDKYGRYYNWNTALKACPKGWHLPSNAEWDKLYHYVDGTSGCVNCTQSSNGPYESPDAGKHLKANFGWNDFNGKSGNGSDSYGFTALPGGSHSGKFNLAGDNGYWWTASESDNGNAYYRFILKESEGAGWNKKTKSLLLNVRCLKD